MNDNDSDSDDNGIGLSRMSDIFRSDEWSMWMIKGSVCMIDVFITWSKTT